MFFFAIFLVVAGLSKSFVSFSLISPAEGFEQALSFYRESESKHCIQASSNESSKEFVPWGCDTLYCPGTYVSKRHKDWIILVKPQDEYPSVVTNSSGNAIGGSCAGVGFFVCVVIYLLYRLLRPNPQQPNSPEPFVIVVAPASEPAQAPASSPNILVIRPFVNNVAPASDHVPCSSPPKSCWS